MASISRALGRIKQDLQEHLPEGLIEMAAGQAGHTWRQRTLGPVATIHLFVLQILHGNTAIRHLRHLAKFRFSAAAYCKARMRLPLIVLQRLLRDSAQRLGQSLQSSAEAEKPGGWCGLKRVLLVDGSASITPDNPELQKAFGQPSNQKKGCGLPVPKVLGLFDAFSGLVLELLAFHLFVGEASQLWKLHPLLQAGDLLVGDRGLGSYVQLALLQARGVFGLFRLRCGRPIVNFRPHRKAGGKGRPTSRWVKRLGKYDQLVRWVKSKTCPRWMSPRQYAALPDTLLVREIRYWVTGRGCRSRCVTIATTLLDPLLYPKEKIAELYGLRWRVETHFAQLKTTLKMRRLKCKTEAGARKELAAYCLVYNLVHAVMVAAGRRQGVEPDRISFIDAVRWLMEAEVGEEMADLVVNPRRPGRYEPRVIKDLQDTYRKMTRPRKYLRNHPNSRYAKR